MADYGRFGGSLSNKTNKRVLIWLGGEGCKFVAAGEDSYYTDDVDLYKDPDTGIWYKISGSGTVTLLGNGKKIVNMTFGSVRRANDEEIEQMKDDNSNCPDGCFTNDYKYYG